MMILGMACQNERPPPSLDTTRTDTQSTHETNPTQSSNTPVSSTDGSLTHPFVGFMGTEQYEEAFNQKSGQPVDCRLVWQTLGTPVSPHECSDCEFVFDVDKIFDDWAESFAENGSCGYNTGDAVDGALDSTVRYAYQLDYYDLGPVLLIGTGDAYYAWGYANLSDKVLTYSRVLLNDLPYNGYYYTQQHYGSATIE